jgi:hypothetical protein
MVRADYGGDGATAPRDGTRIAFCDLDGVRRCVRTERDFEAGWSRHGAVCVAQPRVPERVSLAALAQLYRRLAGHFGPTCTFAAAAADERAVLFSWVPRS